LCHNSPGYSRSVNAFSIAIRLFAAVDAATDMADGKPHGDHDSGTVFNSRDNNAIVILFILE
jgi:hypothetical protein